MSRSIPSMAECGASELVDKAEGMLQNAIADHGGSAPLIYANTVYYLPIILAESAKAVETAGDLQPVLKRARELLLRSGSAAKGADASLASLLAAEAIEALRSLDGGSFPISDAQVRTWGVQLADGRMPGMALVVGSLTSSSMVCRLVEELRRYNLLCLLAGEAEGRSVLEEVQEAELEAGDRSFVVPLGREASAAVHALGFAARCSMKLGGHKPGMWAEILHHSRKRVPGFVLVLGEASDADWAIARAAKAFGFSILTDRPAVDGREILSVPLDSLPGASDAEIAAQLVQRCAAARGLKLRLHDVHTPLAYHPGFEEEVIDETDLQYGFGEGGSSAFEQLQSVPANDIEDGCVQIAGPDVPEAGGDLGIIVRVAGKKIKADHEPYLERQIQKFLNYASGVQHSGRGDTVSLRVSKAIARRGFKLDWLGKILNARFHEEFPAAIEKVEVVLVTDPKQHAQFQAQAREAHALRNMRIAALTDSQVQEFYVCTNCRAFAPNNISIISPEHVSPCGECSWLDAKAAYELNPAGVRRPIQPGKPIDMKKGIWEGLNAYASATSHGRIKEIALYSLMQSPMSACGSFDCIVMLIPEANGVMVVSHEDTSTTPAGIGIGVFTALSAGEQIPGVVGIGKQNLLSPRFIAAEGGFKRVVWMSSRLKASMAEELKAVCLREGEPDLMGKIADERQATSVSELIQWLREHKHPALEMEKMY